MSGRDHPKDRVAGGDGEQFVVGRVRTHAVEEDADLEFPALQVGAEDGGLLRVGELLWREALDAPAQPEFTLARRPQVAYPLGDAAWRDQVAAALEVEQVDRRLPQLAARPAFYVQ